MVDAVFPGGSPGSDGFVAPPKADRPSPPQPLPDNLWGEHWQFVGVPAGEVCLIFEHRPIPIVAAPESRWPLTLGLASTAIVPGIVIQGGRRSLALAQWLQEQDPQELVPMTGDPWGLILWAGGDRRWVMATFTDPGVIQSAQVYQQRRSACGGLHFLLVQPDDSAMTHTGFWLLQAPTPPQPPAGG
jgi:hypothetical protein